MTSRRDFSTSAANTSPVLVPLQGLRNAETSSDRAGSGTPRIWGHSWGHLRGDRNRNHLFGRCLRAQCGSPRPTILRFRQTDRSLRSVKRSGGRRFEGVVLRSPMSSPKLRADCTRGVRRRCVDVRSGPSLSRKWTTRSLATSVHHSDSPSRPAAGSSGCELSQFQMLRSGDRGGSRGVSDLGLFVRCQEVRGRHCRPAFR